MGAELYGYPPEEDYRAEEEVKFRSRYEEAWRKNSELMRKVQELTKKKAEEEFGVVAERHIWNVTLSVPRSMLSFAHTNKSAQVVTAGRSAAEAAMAAEALAKGISDKATVIGISYANETNALK